MVGFHPAFVFVSCTRQLKLGPSIESCAKGSSYTGLSSIGMIVDGDLAKTLQNNLLAKLPSSTLNNRTSFTCGKRYD